VGTLALVLLALWGLWEGYRRVIEPEDFERMRPQPEPGEILLLDTGSRSTLAHPITIDTPHCRWRPQTGRWTRRSSCWRWTPPRRTSPSTEFLFLPLNIVGGDGAPARVLGRAIRD
jgi:kynurenine formamidase